MQILWWQAKLLLVKRMSYLSALEDVHYKVLYRLTGFTYFNIERCTFITPADSVIE